jgi:hypothetical protein
MAAIFVIVREGRQFPTSSRKRTIKELKTGAPGSGFVALPVRAKKPSGGRSTQTYVKRQRTARLKLSGCPD